MKKTVMIAAGLMFSGAALAQTGGTTEANWNNSAMNGYPACSASVTDSCIQLYERGVSASANLAVNEQMMASATAQGGPYEPVGAHAEGEMAQSGDMSAMHNSATGVGGPVDERTGYPPCDPGPGDDSCIQLYERGVTGSGN